MEGNSCGLGRLIHSLRHRAGSRSDMMMCQRNLMHLHSSSEALEPQWPPFMMEARGEVCRAPTVKEGAARRSPHVFIRFNTFNLFVFPEGNFFVCNLTSDADSAEDAGMMDANNNSLWSKTAAFIHLLATWGRRTLTHYHLIKLLSCFFSHPADTKQNHHLTVT